MSRVSNNIEGCKKLQLVWLKNMWIVLGTHKGDIRPLVCLFLVECGTSVFAHTKNSSEYQ